VLFSIDKCKRVSFASGQTDKHIKKMEECKRNLLNSYRKYKVAQQKWTELIETYEDNLSEDRQHQFACLKSGTTQGPSYEQALKEIRNSDTTRFDRYKGSSEFKDAMNLAVLSLPIALNSCAYDLPFMVDLGEISASDLPRKIRDSIQSDLSSCSMAIQDVNPVTSNGLDGLKRRLLKTYGDYKEIRNEWFEVCRTYELKLANERLHQYAWLETGSIEGERYELSKRWMANVDMTRFNLYEDHHLYRRRERLFNRKVPFPIALTSDSYDLHTIVNKERMHGDLPEDVSRGLSSSIQVKANP
jgi:hypothetical protein